MRAEARNPRNRRNVDDRAAATFLDMRHGRPDRARRTQQIDIDAALPSCLVIAGAEAGGVAHQDVDAAERLGGRIDIGRQRLQVGHVAGLRMRRDAGCGDRVAHRRETVGAAGADRHRRAGLGETERDRAADAAAAAGDHRPLSRQIDLHPSGPPDSAIGRSWRGFLPAASPRPSPAGTRPGARNGRAGTALRDRDELAPG